MKRCGFSHRHSGLHVPLADHIFRTHSARLGFCCNMTKPMYSSTSSVKAQPRPQPKESPSAPSIAPKRLTSNTMRMKAEEVERAADREVDLETGPCSVLLLLHYSRKLPSVSRVLFLRRRPEPGRKQTAEHALFAALCTYRCLRLGKFPGGGLPRCRLLWLVLRTFRSFARDLGSGRKRCLPQGHRARRCLSNSS